MTTLPEGAAALLDAPEFATVATVDPDGRPQLSVIWVKRDGDDVLFSTVRGRRKTNNIERDPRVGVLVYPKENPYSYLEIRGTATIADDPEAALIHELSQKYLGQSQYPYLKPEDQRVVVRVSPEHVVFHA